MLFEVAIVQKPTKKEMAGGQGEAIVLNPTAIVAQDEQAAAINAVLDHGEKIRDIDRTRMEVYVRPFADPR
jgi:hypothetical protein